MVNPATLAYVPRTTNIAQGTCSTVDFVTLLLGNAGSSGMRVRDIYAAVAAWRNGSVNPRNGQYGPIEHLFSGEYGYISRSYYNVEPALGNPGYMFGTNRNTRWYRQSRGVYALNANGVARYQQLCAG